jgi:hypothetical protein
MITKGDSTCHWVVRKKDAPIGVKDVKPTESKDSALELLKMRLVMGEISLEQYCQLGDLLMEK